MCVFAEFENHCAFKMTFMAPAGFSPERRFSDDESNKTKRAYCVLVKLLRSALGTKVLICAIAAGLNLTGAD